jgi:demethylmenaquinone methyltransferase / 2-methoxy-6-polyprenyl-1,4-benzoquinol methylase
VATSPGRAAPDGSPFPDRASPEFEREIRAMFTFIAGGYDRFDHLISVGGDFLWRPRALWDLDRFTGGRPPATILDLGCGPGTFTVQAAAHFPRARMIGIDMTRAMIEKAPRRPAAGARGRYSWALAQAGRLPFRDGSFDLAMSAFVVRSLPDLPRALREFRRVLRPGGTLLTLEITEPVDRAFGRLFHAYFDAVVPWLGAAIGSEGPYRYLPESLRALPSPPAFVGLLRDAGFARAEAHPQSLGIVTTFLARATG